MGGTRRLEGMKERAGLPTQFSLPELHVAGGCVFLLKSAAAVWWPSLVTAALDGSGNPFYHLLLQSVTCVDYAPCLSDVGAKMNKTCPPRVYVYG